MTLNRSRIASIVSLCAFVTVALFFTSTRQYSNLNRTEPAFALAGPGDAAPDPTHNDVRNYKDAVARLEAERVALASRYREAPSSVQRAEIIDQARSVVTHSIYAEIFPSWYGTVWDFYGTTEVPQQGTIACGYFVSTVLRDAGWRVQRARLAQQASENIILSLTTEPYVKRFRRVLISDFINVVKSWGAGIYVVGLDIHTGFIVNTGSEVYFIHSSYVEPRSVVRERASESKILVASNYRVLGKITADDLFIEKWLLRKEIVTRTV